MSAPADRLSAALSGVEPDKLVVVDNWFEELRAKPQK